MVQVFEKMRLYPKADSDRVMIRVRNSEIQTPRRCGQSCNGRQRSTTSDDLGKKSIRRLIGRPGALHMLSADIIPGSSCCRRLAGSVELGDCCMYSVLVANSVGIGRSAGPTALASLRCLR